MSFGVLGLVMGMNGSHEASAVSTRIDELENRLKEAGLLDETSGEGRDAAD